jgi:hypothetical protein
MMEEIDTSQPVAKSSQTADSSMPKASLSAIWAFGILIVYVALVGILLTSTYASMIIFTTIFTVSYLVLYVGMPAASLCWAVFIVYRLATNKHGCRIIWTLIKYGIVVYGLMGLALFSAGAMLPAPRTLATGYWFHAKVWADVDEVRDWAAKYAPPIYTPTVPWRETPPSLRRNVSYFGGTISYNAKEQSVSHYHGSALGHWGVTVGPKSVPIPNGPYIFRLEDGAWVWYE